MIKQKGLGGGGGRNDEYVGTKFSELLLFLLLLGREGRERESEKELFSLQKELLRTKDPPNEPNGSVVLFTTRAHFWNPMTIDFVSGESGKSSVAQE